MRNLTNNFNLPQPFVDLVAYDDYDDEGSDYSATGLLTPPRIKQLMARHKGELVEDATDRIFAMSGSVKHVVLERIAKMNPERYLIEKRFHTEIAGKKVSAKLDLYDREDCTLYDYKEISMWKLKFDDYSDWEAQANINRLLVETVGKLPVNRLVNMYLLKDWKKRGAIIGKGDYPEVGAGVKMLEIWSHDMTTKFIEERIALHEAAKENLPLCSEADRWAKPEKWALMKKGQKRAVKLYDTELEAEAARIQADVKVGDGKISAKPKHHIEHRPGENTRCLYFCGASHFCTQFREMMQ